MRAKRSNLSANPSEANGGEGNKAPQSITPTHPSYKHTPLGFPADLPRGGSAEGPSLEEACGRSETDGGEGVIASEAKQSLSANPSEANGVRETKHRSQSPRGLQKLRLFRGWDARRPSLGRVRRRSQPRRGVGRSETDGGEGVIASEAKQSLPILAKRTGVRETKHRSQSLLTDATFQLATSHARLGFSADPP